jgi:hypothetical protein
MDSRKLVVVAFLTLAAAGAHAQTAGVVTLRANQTSATGSLTPVLTWSTSPAAQSCTASGGWSGTKAASGTQTLPTISASANYTLTCTWAGTGGNGSATLNWVAPTQNTDGTLLRNLSGYRVVYGTSANALNQTRNINDPSVLTTTITALPAGTWYFAMRAVNTSGGESSNTNVASKTIAGTGGSSSSATVAITITAPPTTPPPTTKTLKTFETRVGDVAKIDGIWRVTRIVGSIPLNTPCDASFRIGTWYRIDRSKVKLTRTPRSTTLVARCELR